MKKISIEEYLQKITPKISLVKYRDICKHFDDNNKTILTKHEPFIIILKNWFIHLDLSSISSTHDQLILVHFRASNYLLDTTF